MTEREIRNVLNSFNNKVNNLYHSRTLVIHPTDRSTEFLKLVYQGKNYDVINDCSISEYDLREAIKNHDKIIMMGHGTPRGLINPGAMSFLINSSHVDLLKEKETISIWCWSDEFFRPYGMKGFHTGVIISECSEQHMMLGKVYLNADEQLENMEFMSRCFNECIDRSPEEIRNYMLEHYNRDDEVSKFNRSKMFVL